VAITAFEQYFLKGNNPKQYVMLDAAVMGFK
jgi:hypothetical protein